MTDEYKIVEVLHITTPTLPYRHSHEFKGKCYYLISDLILNSGDKEYFYCCNQCHLKLKYGKVPTMCGATGYDLGKDILTILPRLKQLETILVSKSVISFKNVQIQKI